MLAEAAGADDVHRNEPSSVDKLRGPDRTGEPHGVACVIRPAETEFMAANNRVRSGPVSEITSEKARCRSNSLTMMRTLAGDQPKEFIVSENTKFKTLVERSGAKIE
jgi:hypothetical protein